MNKIFVLFFCIVFLTGCSSLTKEQLKERHCGIIDACYTVMEYQPQDEEERINTYLQKKVDSGQLTLQEKQIIIKCINRTKSSKRWK